MIQAVFMLYGHKRPDPCRNDMTYIVIYVGDGGYMIREFVKFLHLLYHISIILVHSQNMQVLHALVVDKTFLVERGGAVPDFSPPFRIDMAVRVDDIRGPVMVCPDALTAIIGICRKRKKGG